MRAPHGNEGFIYIKVTDVLPEFKTLPGVEKLIGLVKVGKTNNITRRDEEYKIYLPMLFNTTFAVRVDDRHVAEQLVLEHFQKHNVRGEFDALARVAMSPELAKVASMVGVECLRIDPEAVKTVLLLLVVKIRRNSPPRSEAFCGFAAYSRGSICRIRSTRRRGRNDSTVARRWRIFATSHRFFGFSARMRSSSSGLISGSPVPGRITSIEPRPQVPRWLRSSGARRFAAAGFFFSGMG